MLGSRGWAALESPSWGGAGDLGGRRGRFPCTGQCLKHQRCSKWGAWAEAAALLGVLELLLSSWAPQPAAPALQLPSISAGVTGAGWHLPGDAQRCSAWCACHKASVTGRVLQRGEVATWGGLRVWGRAGSWGLLPCPRIGDAVGAALLQTRALPAARGGEELALLLALPRQRWARWNPTCLN